MKRFFRNLLLVFCASIIAWMTTSWNRHSIVPFTKEQRDQVRAHLDWADRESNLRLNARLDEFEAFFLQRRQRCRAYAETVLGIRSKLTLASDYMPWSDGKAHAKLVSDKFQEMVVSPQEISDLVKFVVEGFETDIEATENEMLVRMKADLDHPSLAPGQPISDQSIANCLAKVIQSQQQRSVATSHQEIAGFVATTLLSEIITPVVIDVMTSAGIITAGGLSTLETLGAGLAVAVVIDYGYSKIADPAGKLAKVLDTQLRSIHDQIRDGTIERPGLKSYLLDMQQSCHQRRQRAVESFSGR